MSDIRISIPDPCEERWDRMQPQGCNRFCATCSETIHDLSALTSQEAETLLRKPGKRCVRAEVGPDGALVTKPNGSATQRRILVAVGASLGLLTAACETVPQTSSPSGLIVGTVDPRRGARSVTAVSNTGRIYQAKVLSNGSFKFKPLPYGQYSLKFIDDCGGWEGGRVNLEESRHAVTAPPSPTDCIIVGRVEVERDQG